MSNGPHERLRVLVAHNAYQQRGGEDAVAEAEVQLLREHGHEVRTYERHNDELNDQTRLGAAAGTLWSRGTTRDLARMVRDFAPHIIHAHNTFPLISPSLYWAAAEARIPVIQTLHNFRLLCPQALLLRDGRVCEDCVGRVPWRAVKHRCYRGSAAQSGVVVTMLQLHRALGTWQDKVTRYIALNDFCKAKFVQGGLPAERIDVKPNFVDLPACAEYERSGFLFVGRVAAEKGIETLARAGQLLSRDTPVRVAGSGPEVALLACQPRFRLLGALRAEQVYEQMAQAKALILPSIWYENFPRTLVEAYACALPVIASRLGALTSLVREGETGLLFEPGNGADLATKLAWAEDHPAEMRRMGAAGRAYYERHLTGAVNHGQLMAIYQRAMQGARSRVSTS